MKDRPTLHQQFTGIGFSLPFIIGFCVFLAFPLLHAVYFSFTQYPMLKEPILIGFDNFKKMAIDPIFWQALRNTLYFALMSVPFGLFVSILLALLLNQSVRAPGLWRTVVMLPSLVPSVASAMLWLWLLNGKQSLVSIIVQTTVDWIVSFFLWLARICGNGIVSGWFQDISSAISKNIGPPDWLGSPAWVLPTIAFIGFWGIGQTVIIFLAGLQDIPKEMYEAAEIDGANVLQRLRHVTLPILSPVIFFNLTMGIIGSWSVFDGPYILTGGGGTNRSAYFYAMYIRDSAFLYQKVGYASALACIQFLIVMGLTGLIIWSSRRWVHYR